MMFIAMNNFKVVPGREADFEAQWRNRQSYLDQVPGFIEFALLKGDEPGEYISHTVWQDRDAFVAWTKSDSFIAGHRQGSVAGVLQGHPIAKLYDAVIVEHGRVLATGGS
jgi:heme-degrading monooxygenase HmoA